MMGALALTAAPAAAQEQGAERIELVRELAIGGAGTGPEYEFFAIGHAAVASSGVLYAAVYEGPSAIQVRRYDPSGRYLGAVGRSGAGPGEYRRVEGMALLGDSVLVLYDLGNARVSLFDTTGAFLTSFPAAGAYIPGGTSAAYTDGTIAARTPTGSGPNQPAGAVSSVFVRQRLDGRILDSLSAPPEQVSDFMMSHRSLGRRWAFTETTVFTILPRGGIATALTTRVSC
jgi:hypothetical protein